jgi:rhodopsin domain-containing protein
MEVFNLLDVYRGGAGKHTYDTTIDQFVLRYRVCNRVFNSLNNPYTNSMALQYQFIISTLYIITTFFVKTSIISFLRRLLNASIRWNYFFYALYVCNFIISFVAFFNNFFLCRPVSAIWDLRVYAATGGRCRNLFLETLVFCIIYALSDVILLAIPLSVVTTMTMRKKSKVATIFVFALGGLSCIFAIWKAAYLSAVRGSFDDSCKSLRPQGAHSDIFDRGRRFLKT